jgi:glucan phosphorylase
MEFLPGRLLGNIILNLSECKEVKEVIDELGFDLNYLEDHEPDPALEMGAGPACGLFYGFSCDTGLSGHRLRNTI